ncbi:MAG: hypothetical protein ACE5EX_03745 [Phycisphaerae bacterium]
MVRKTVLTITLITGCVWCLALASRADSAHSAPAIGSFKPVATVESLMHGQKHYFKAINRKLRKKNSPKRNGDIAEAAEVLAELANVNRYNKDKDDYRTWATQLRDTALELAREAKKKADASDDRMQTLLASLKSACGACHDAYQ